MLRIENLHANVAGQEILRGLDLEVGAGEVHAIMGPNGSGKSTLAHVIAGKDGYQVTSGTVRLEGRDVLALAPDAAAQLIHLASAASSNWGVAWTAMPNSTSWGQPKSSISASYSTFPPISGPKLIFTSPPSMSRLALDVHWIPRLTMSLTL